MDFNYRYRSFSSLMVYTSAVNDRNSLLCNTRDPKRTPANDLHT